MITKFNKFLNESIQDEKKYVFDGTCLDSFDEDGDCINGTFDDVEDFSNSWETAEEITAEEFWKHIDPSSDKYDEVVEYTTNREYPPEFRYSEDYDIYFAFVNDDTHYFFIK